MKKRGEKQFPEMMTARELSGYLTRYGDYGNNPGGLPHEALIGLNPGFAGLPERSRSMGALGSSIERVGVLDPILISHGSGSRVLRQGHHRVLMQSFFDPDRPIPVEHYEEVG